MSYQKVGLLYHPRDSAALALAQSLRARIDLAAVWLAETGDEQTAGREMTGTDLLVCVGGDGTTLWAARLAGPQQCHLVSVNMGRLGFLSALSPEDAAAGLARIIAGEGETEERAMVECLPIVSGGGRGDVGLNDVVVGRSAPGRPVYISIEVDGQRLATVRADAMIVATATGSTAYNLSAGGPILLPTAQNLLVTPVAPHLSRMRPFVLPPEAVIDLTVQSDFNAVVSVDGQIVRELQSGETIRCRRATQTARFLVLGGAGEFFHRLALHLNLTSRGENPAI